ncbi:MAG: DUF202 domain-containing protein [Proteobacteria bacterium]|nr:DUF202 domain-containing protein [Pseudomonadota bacterium]
MQSDTPAAEEAAERLEQSAGAVEHSGRDLTQSADRRTELAGDRTVLAAERTYAAWVRTGLAALASGVGAPPLLEGALPELLIGATASVLVLFSAFCFAAGVWREIDPDTPWPEADARQLPPVLLIDVNGFLVLVALTALVGIWTRAFEGAAG